MPTSDNQLARLFGKRPEAVPDLPTDEVELVETADPRVGARPQLSVTFIDQQGRPFQFSYSHLYRCYAEGAALVCEFSGHRVTVEGTGLTSPAKACLMRRLGMHTVEFVEAVPRGEFDGGVTAITVRELRG